MVYEILNKMEIDKMLLTGPHMAYLQLNSFTIWLSNFKQPMPLYWYNFCPLLAME